jgi:8-oxo-dGTP pyrophosphatase MutT (NUDIX family)
VETTRHFTATVYVVRDGQTALHDHRRAGTWLPPGGHIERDEVPRATARREVLEETGLAVTLNGQTPEISTDRVTELPGPERFLIIDVHAYGDGSVAHQHLDFVYYGKLEDGEISPADDSLSAADWSWFDNDELRTDDRIDPDVAVQGLEAIEMVSDTS